MKNKLIINGKEVELSFFVFFLFISMSISIFVCLGLLSILMFFLLEYTAVAWISTLVMSIIIGIYFGVKAAAHTYDDI